jgi:hypothetical protein
MVSFLRIECEALEYALLAEDFQEVIEAGAGGGAGEG